MHKKFLIASDREIIDLLLARGFEPVSESGGHSFFLNDPERYEALDDDVKARTAGSDVLFF